MTKEKKYDYSAINVKKETAKKFRQLEEKTGLRREKLILAMIDLFEQRQRGDI